jgi:ankyrin repeat protein
MVVRQEALMGAQLKMTYTNLYLHLMHGHNKEAMECIQQRKDVNTPCGTFGNTPLHISAEKGLTDIVERLLQEDTDANAQNKFDETPLHLSVMLGHHEITELLLNEHADSNIKNCNGETPFNQTIIMDNRSSES